MVAMQLNNLQLPFDHGGGRDKIAQRFAERIAGNRGTTDNHRSTSFWRLNFNFGATANPPAPTKKVQYSLGRLGGDSIALKCAGGDDGGDVLVLGGVGCDD